MPNYGSVAEANAFFADRLHSYDWDNATVGDRQLALNQATELIDQFDYICDKYAVTILGEDATEEQKRAAELSQPLQFPRGDSNVIPTEVEHACYLIAKALLSGRDPDADLEALGTRSTSYGEVRTTYQRDGNHLEHITHLIPSPQAYNLLRPFFRERNEFEIKRV